MSISNNKAHFIETPTCQGDDPEKDDLNEIFNEEDQEGQNYNCGKKNQIENPKFLKDITCIRNGQNAIKKQQDDIMKNNEELLRQLEFFEITFGKKISSIKEITNLERELIQRRENLQNIFLVDNFNCHLTKQHEKSSFKDVEEVISFFLFLQSKSIIYDGWHSFHCVSCMEFIVKHQQNIQKSIKQYKNLQQQIDDLRSCV